MDIQKGEQDQWHKDDYDTDAAGDCSELGRIERILAGTGDSPGAQPLFEPQYGNLTLLNGSRVILDAVGESLLSEIVRDFLDLVGTSAAVYEKNGDYALGIFSSGWCRFMDQASRELCETHDNLDALDSGKWLCHESCWNGASKRAIETGEPVDWQCHGGIAIHAVPIYSKGEVIGAVNMGYGEPPVNDPHALGELARKYRVSPGELVKHGAEYEPRPPFIVEIAKKRLRFAGHLISTIVERHQAEQKYEMLFREMIDGFALHEIICDAGGKPVDYRFLDINPAFERLTGLKKESLVGRRVLEVLPNTEPHWIEKYGNVALGRGHDSFENYSRELGRYFQVTAFSPAYGRFACIFVDVTEKKQMENQLRQAQKMEAIGTLAGGIAHDFNNTLYPILGHAEILKQELPGESPLQDNVGSIIKGALRSKTLIRQILTFTRQVEQEIRPIAIQPVLQESLKLMRVTIPANIVMELEISPDCGKVNSDPVSIHQIVLNLVTNAMHAMEKTGGTIRVTLQEMEIPEEQMLGHGPGIVHKTPSLHEEDEKSLFGYAETGHDHPKPGAGKGHDHPKLGAGDSHDHPKPGRYLKLTVSDTGPGMERKTLEKIFDPYFTTKPVGKGTGMGLSVVQGIVKASGGEIFVQSRPGVGTDFYIFLPTVSTIDKSRPHAGPVSDAIPGGSETILLVDDEPSIGEVEKMMLTRIGYKVVDAPGSVEALELFRKDPGMFDVVLTDMTMPVMTGLQLAGEIKTIRADIPVILCTGFNDQVNEDTFAVLGIDAYLNKPVPMKRLAMKIKDVLLNPHGRSPASPDHGNNVSISTVKG
ncbi:MAG: response regulator [Desulfamplus sp.]|nr:response regulator [Desulfamplus sp.]